jgi:hypothetical protein
MSNTELLNQLLNLTVWLPIKDYPNYEVSITGSVRNINSKRILKPSINRNGYYFLELNKNNQRKIFKVHRLVCLSFIPNLKNKKCVDHVDNNKFNNTISNLRWCDSFENQHNRQLNKNNKSSVKGVRFENNKWRAQIRFNNKSIHIGYFTNLDDAKLARQKKAAELFGIYTNECEK